MHFHTSGIVITFPSGERSLFTMDPSVAYGVAGAGWKIPPNATVKFDIELLGWAAWPCQLYQVIIADPQMLRTEKRNVWQSPFWEAIKHQGGIHSLSLTYLPR